MSLSEQQLVPLSADLIIISDYILREAFPVMNSPTSTPIMLSDFSFDSGTDSAKDTSFTWIIFSWRGLKLENACLDVKESHVSHDWEEKLVSSRFSALDGITKGRF